MIHTTFPAMGTTIEVIADGKDGVAACRDLFADLEACLSRFLPGSELSLINASREISLQVSPTMGAVLSIADDMRARTNGMIDPAVGAAVSAWGYDRTFAEVTDREDIPENLQCGEWRIDGQTLEREPNVRLDLGGLAKGWAADQAVEREMALLVSAGGDVRSVIEGSQVELIDPWEKTPATVVLGIGGMATSSVSRRRWKAGGREVHHIIDPTTAAPARSPVLSASARCGTAAEAEAAAKAVLLHGERGLVWAERQLWIDAAMVIWHDSSVFATQGWEMAA